MAHRSPLDQDLTSALRAGRDALVLDTTTRGIDFGVELSAVIDGTLAAILTRTAVEDVCIVALGSYARRELCPGSDVDVLLLVPAPGRFAKRRDWRPMAERLWYPLWDAGFVTGHSARTIKECLALAADDLDARTALLDIRFVAGDPQLCEELAVRATRCAARCCGESPDALVGCGATP